MATEVAVAVGSKIGDYLIRQIGGQLGYLIHYKSNIENLMKQVQKLKGKRDGLKPIVDEARNNGDNILPNVQQWLESVDELCAKATNFYEREVKENNGYFKGWCPNLKACYTLSKEAKKKTAETAELQKEGVFPRISTPAPPLAIGFTSMADFRSFESRVPTIEDIVNLLKGDEVSMIGICGMGGVGKTTMVEEIVRRVRDEKLFDKIVIAVVSQNQDSMKIQDEIAYHLGMKLEVKNSVPVRADCLWKRLMESSKGNLVILDDMWESIDLKKIGIPYGGEYKRCKIVVTSRIEDVCKVMKCGEIFKIKVLSEKEAWSLFREMAGDSVDAQDLYLTASNVAKECGGLPISLVTVGKALNGKSKEEWDNALNQLRKSIVPATLSEVESKVYRSLQLSYDHLGSKEAKLLFLLCCFFPEDTNIPLEDLVRYGVGLRLFEDIELLTQARDRVLALTMELKSCFLLLDGNKKFYVRLHDVVRDVGITIARASKENHYNMKMIHGERWPMVKDDEYKDCNALSVISNTISDFPSGGLDCPNLEVLRLACKNLSQEVLNSRTVFGGMPGLRVLDMWGMPDRSLPPCVWLLMNLRVLCLNDCNRFENICEIPKGLGNLEILSINDNFAISELPEDIGRLTNLRLLDMRGCSNRKIPTSVFSCLRLLEDLHTGGWRPAEEGDESDNASFSQLESLSNLTSLATWVQHARLLPKSSFLEKLKRYVIVVGVSENLSLTKLCSSKNCFLEKSLSLVANCIDDAPLGGGIDHLLKQSTETLSLRGDGLKIVLDQLFPGGSTHLRKLYIKACNGKVEYLVDTGRAELVPPNIGVFAKLEKLILKDLTHLKEICHGQQLPAGSFGSLQKMKLVRLHALTHLWDYRNQSVTLSNLRFVCVLRCDRLGNLFTLSVARSLVNLESLDIQFNGTMEEVISNQGPSGTTKTNGLEPADIHIIEFPKLIEIRLNDLSSLTCFSKGIDQINLPQLNVLEIICLPKLLSFCLEEGSRNVALADNQTVHLQSLFNHKVKLTNLKNLLLEGLGDMTEIWSDQLDGDSFHELKKVQVIWCNSISTVLRCNMTQGFQNLEELNVKECRLVERVFEYGELNDISEEGHAAVVLFPRLKVLRLTDLPKLTQIWKKCIRMNHDFTELTIIRIKKCHSMKLVFSTSIAKVLVNLLVLGVKNCKMMEQIVANDNPEGERSGFQNLLSLSLHSLPNLTSVCSGRLNFPSLVELKLEMCSRLKMFFSSSFLNSEMNKQPLFGDQKLGVKKCETMEQIVSNDHPEGERSEFQHLSSLSLEYLDNLTSVCSGQFYFPSLVELNLNWCDKMKTFSESSFMNSEINKQPLFGNQVKLTNLRNLLLEGLGDMTEIWSDQLDGDSFHELKKVEVIKCHSISTVLRCNMTQGFQNLEELRLLDCRLVEGVFEYGELNDISDEGHTPVVLLPRLKELRLTNIPKLTQIWKKHIRMNHDFRELNFIHIERCHSMKLVFSTSVAKALVKLQELRVEECEMMEQIVANDHPEGETSELSGMMEFQNLRSLSLRNLNNLTSVCSGRLYFPSLVKLELNWCSKLKSFSSSSFLNSEMNKHPLSGDQVTFPILEKLHIGGWPNFKEFCYSQIPTGSFQKLRVLQVWKCNNLVNFIPSHLPKVFSSLEELEVYECDSMEELFESKGMSIEGGYHATLIETLRSIKVARCDHIRNLFPSSIARGLVHLQQLEVNFCKMMEEIFTEKVDEDGREDKTLFPALEILQLKQLPRLKSFCNVNYTIELPVLKDVRIFYCSEMTTFSSSFVRTPKLAGVILSYNQWGQEIIWMGNLNKTIEHLFKGKETQEQESEDDSDEHSED